MALAVDTERAQSLSDGLRLGNTATDRWSFGGVTPSAQSVTTKTAWQVLEDHGAVATGTDYSVQHATVAVTAANIIAMYTTPVVIVAAPGSGKTIEIVKLSFRMTRTATAFTGGAAVIFQYDSTANGAGVQALDSTLASTVITGAAGTTTSVRNGAVLSDLSTTLENKGIYISNGTAVFAAGTGTAVVDIWYVVHGGV